MYVCFVLLSSVSYLLHLLQNNLYVSKCCGLAVDIHTNVVCSDELLIEFFNFYSDFDFAEHGVSVLAGTVVEKPDPSAPIYIENPLELELNVAKNVLDMHLQAFQANCHLARDTLRHCVAARRTHQKGDLWGLLSILKTDDQLLLTEDVNTLSSTSDEDVDHIPLTSSQDDVVDSEHGSDAQQRQPVGVVDIHDILHADKDVDDKVVDSAAHRTL